MTRLPLACLAFLIAAGVAATDLSAENASGLLRQTSALLELQPISESEWPAIQTEFGIQDISAFCRWKSPSGDSLFFASSVSNLANDYFAFYRTPTGYGTLSSTRRISLLGGKWSRGDIEAEVKPTGKVRKLKRVATLRFQVDGVDLFHSKGGQWSCGK